MNLSNGQTGDGEDARTSKWGQRFSRLHRWGKHDRGIRSAAVFFVVGLALEVIATLWAFNQARAAGGLYGDVACASGDLAVLHVSALTQKTCKKMDASMVETAQEDNFWLEHGCKLTDIPTGGDSYETLCFCTDDGNADADPDPAECYWVNARKQYDYEHLCIALPFVPIYFSSTGTRLVNSYGFVPDRECWPKSARGTKKITLLATSISLASQAVEGVAGRQYFKKPNRGPFLMVAASALEAAGVVTIFWFFINMEMFNSDAQFFWLDSGNVSPGQRILRCLGVAAAVCAVFGGLVEVVAGCLIAKWSGGSSNSVSRKHRIHYLSAFGGAAVWLGAAVLEVVVTTHLVLQSKGMINDDVDNVNWDVFRTALISLVALEVLALVVLWAAKYLWTRAKLRYLVQMDD